jgi:aldehyde dehydrogenase (NAD+)
MNTFQTVFEQQKRRRCDPNARYLDPTIIYPVSWKDPIMDEVFEPILPIVTYRTLDEAFDRISAAPSPLTAFIFSRNRSAIDWFVGELSFGGGAVSQVNIHLFVESIVGRQFEQKTRKLVSESL